MKPALNQGSAETTHAPATEGKKPHGTPNICVPFETLPPKRDDDDTPRLADT